MHPCPESSLPIYAAASQCSETRASKIRNMLGYISSVFMKDSQDHFYVGFIGGLDQVAAQCRRPIFSSSKVDESFVVMAVRIEIGQVLLRSQEKQNASHGRQQSKVSLLLDCGGLGNAPTNPQYRSMSWWGFTFKPFSDPTALECAENPVSAPARHYRTDRCHP